MINYRIRQRTKGAFPKRFLTDDIVEECETWREASSKTIKLNKALCEKQGYRKTPDQEPGYYVEELIPDIPVVERKPYPSTRARSVY